MGKSVVKVSVPDVTSKNVTDATNALSTAGFKVSVKNVANDSVPANQVFEQSPKGNTNAGKGSTVEITVSSGIGDGTVPDVVGRTQAAAESLLKTNNFIPEVKEASSDTVAKGTVISQSPSANGKATKNSVVTITVSSGAGDVSIPECRRAYCSAGIEPTWSGWVHGDNNFAVVIVKPNWHRDQHESDRRNKSGEGFCGCHCCFDWSASIDNDQHVNDNNDYSVTELIGCDFRVAPLRSGFVV